MAERELGHALDFLKTSIVVENMAVEIGLLKSITCFSGLSFDELNAIKSLTFEKTFPTGDIILLEGEYAEALYFVVSGAVKVFKTSAEGREQTLKVLRLGEPLNDVSILDGGPNLASAQAIGPVLLYGIEKSDLKTILSKYPRVAMNIINILVSQVRHLASLVEELSFKPVIGRLAKVLLEYASDGPGPRPRLTQQEIAALVGTAREVVGRSLKALEAGGIIRFERHRLVIVDRKALQEVARVSS